MCFFQTHHQCRRKCQISITEEIEKQNAQINECQLIYTLLMNSKSSLSPLLFFPEGTVLAPYHYQTSPHTEFKMLFHPELCLIFRSGMVSAHFQTWRSPRKASRCCGTPPSSSPISHCCLSAPTQTPWREQLGLCRT